MFDIAGETTFKITNTKLYSPIVTLSTKDNVKLTKQSNEGFKRPVYWNGNYNVLIDGRHFYDQSVNGQINKYDEIRKIATEQAGDYTAGCLLDCNFSNIIINQLQLILLKKKDYMLIQELFNRLNFKSQV